MRAANPSVQKARKRTNRVNLETGEGKTRAEVNEKVMKSIHQRDTCSPMFVAALFTIAKICKQPKCPSKDEWRWICTMEYYSAIKRMRSCHL